VGKGDKHLKGMMRIAVDAMGGEHAPHEVVRGAMKACHDHCGEIVLVGKESTLRSELANYNLRDLQLSIVDANEVVEFHEHPTQAVRNKRDSSIVVGMNLLKRGDVAAFVSAGNSGAVMAAALLTLGSIEGIERPALGCLFSAPEHPVLLLDVGANADCKPGFLVQFAQMGSVYMERVFAVKRPRIGLLSNGEEENKGNQLVRESHVLLKKTSLNFWGCSAPRYQGLGLFRARRGAPAGGEWKCDYCSWQKQRQGYQKRHFHGQTGGGTGGFGGNEARDIMRRRSSYDKVG
jgi:glycerol-3-phosphate acyltransferase PlsX